jgi:hypothetical protein
MQFVLTFVCLPLATLTSWLILLAVAWAALTGDLSRHDAP